MLLCRVIVCVPDLQLIGVVVITIAATFSWTRSSSVSKIPLLLPSPSLPFYFLPSS